MQLAKLFSLCTDCGGAAGLDCVINTFTADLTIVAEYLQLSWIIKSFTKIRCDELNFIACLAALKSNLYNLTVLL